MKKLVYLFAGITLFTLNTLAVANQNQGQEPVELNLRIVNNSGANIYYAQSSIMVFTGPNWHSNEFIKCGRIKGQDNFPLSDGQAVNLAVYVDDVSCFDILTTFTIANEQPTPDIDNIPNPEPDDIDQCVVTVNYNQTEQSLEQSIWCDGLSKTSDLSNESWGPLSNKSTTLTFK